MCKCTPEMRTPFCGKPGCEWPKSQFDDLDAFKEALADLAHEQWTGWMKYLFSKCVPYGDGSMRIPADLVGRWHRQTQTAYEDLSEKEKDSDRKEADKYLLLIRKNTDRLLEWAIEEYGP